jgi:hypothetical protein
VRAQERAPRRRWRLTWASQPLGHILRDRVLGDVVTKLGELTGNRDDSKVDSRLPYDR